MEPVIVVHGTFANEATWWRPDGSFCKILNSQLELMGSDAKCWDSIPTEAIGEYGWSGLNSEASRTYGAEKLAKKILELSQREGVRKIHFVAHSHGGNVLVKSLLLFRRKIAKEKLGCFIFLGTPFISYKSISPPSLFASLFFLDSGVWQRAQRVTEEAKLRKEYSEYYGGTFFSIQSKHDEAFQVLRHSVELRNSAFTYSRKWTQKSRSGASPPNSLSPFTMMELRMGRYDVESIATSRREQDHGFRMKIGYFSWIALLMSVIGLYGLRLLVVSVSPLFSMMKRWGQRWGTYFGIKSMVSTALGDDLAFEKIVSVDKVSDVVPTTMITLNERLEEAVLAKTVSGADELLLRLYRSASSTSAELEFGTMAGAVCEVLSAKRLVHSQYYDDESIVNIAASAISGRLQLD
jgi:pimeloyl-ACP methyl ester carboxylesterase